MQEMDEQVALLLYKLVAGQELEKEEHTILESWLSASPQNKVLLAELMDEAKLEKEVRALLAIDEDAALKKLQEKITRERNRFGTFSVRMLQLGAAILVLLALAAGVYSWFHRPVGPPLAKESAKFNNDISPGTDNALLQLADGSTIRPDSNANGILQYQGGTAVTKKERGLLEYDAPAVAADPKRALVYNIVTTPRKSRYRLVLSDGSRVWLNAASSLRFPVAFADDRREVELSGEAYFDVAAKTATDGGKIPFIVKIITPSGKAGEVEVRGTQFNINAYPDEGAISTTLVEGRVLLRPPAGGQSPILLGPGQQARLAGDGTVQLLKPDMEQALAWKNDLFLFHDTDIETIMRMVSRWYDVKVVYDGKITETFNGKITRNVPLSKLLDILEQTGDVSFAIDGNSITVKNLQ